MVAEPGRAHHRRLPLVPDQVHQPGPRPPAGGIDAAGIYAFFRLEAIEGGGLPTAEVLDISRLTKPGDLPEFGRSDAAHRIRRLRRIAGRPAALEEIWLDASWSETVQRSEVLESLYLYYRTKLGLWITRAEDRIGIGTVPDWAPPAFGLAVRFCFRFLALRLGLAVRAHGEEQRPARDLNVSLELLDLGLQLRTLARSPSIPARGSTPTWPATSPA